MNPWHAARTLLNPEVPDGVRYKTKAETRQQRSVFDELNPLGHKFMKARFRGLGPMFKRDQDEWNTGPMFNRDEEDWDLLSWKLFF